MSSNGSRIQRLRLHGQPAAFLDDRARRAAVASVEGWLQAHPPQRHGLPADAIVLLRSLRAPLSALRGPEGDALLGRCLRGAVRLARAQTAGGGVGAGVEAVWFADEPELLACLARDAVSGELGRAWWWRTLIPATPDVDTALRRWLHQPRCVPSAMQALRLSGHAPLWLEAIGPNGRRRLLQALTGSHPLHSGWSNWLIDRVADGAWDPAQAPAGLGEGVPGPAHPSPAAGRSPHRLRLDGSALLLGLCDLMHQQPHRGLDGASLGRLVASLIEAVPLPSPYSSPSSPSSASSISSVPHRVNAGASHIDSLGSPQGQDTGWRGAQGTSRRQGVPSGAPEASVRSTMDIPWPQTPAPSFVSQAETESARPGELDEGRARAEPWRGTASDTAGDSHPDRALARQRSDAPDGFDKGTHRPESHAATSVAAPFDTEAGGLFFMLNVALAWGLYGDFTQPQHRGLGVSPWQFLHAAGVALLGRGFRADPLAGWLRAQTPFVSPSPWPPGSGRARGRPNELSVWWPRMRQRLAEVMDLPAPEALCLSLNLRARVRCTPDRVDVHLSLLELPLRIRIAGLDRDPGWIPAAGRDVRFHFEVPPT